MSIWSVQFSERVHGRGQSPIALSTSLDLSQLIEDKNLSIRVTKSSKQRTTGASGLALNNEQYPTRVQQEQTTKTTKFSQH